jgi:hypothetical protein
LDYLKVLDPDLSAKIINIQLWNFDLFGHICFITKHNFVNIVTGKVLELPDPVFYVFEA